MKIRQFNILYYVLSILLYVLLTMFIKHASWAMFCFEMLYIAWIICSAFIIYHFQGKYGLKKEFVPKMKYEGINTTFWLDEKNRKLAILCMGNPFRIRYIALEDIDKAEIEVVKPFQNKSGGQYAYGINLLLFIKGKKNLFGVNNDMNRGVWRTYVNMDKQGKKEQMDVQHFIEYLMYVKSTER